MGTLVVALRPAIDSSEGDHKGPHPTLHHPRPYGDEAAFVYVCKKTTRELVFDSRHLADSKEKGEFGKRSKRDEKKPASHADNA